jgi:glycosyltransferase involved in cell wall biosynthesis
MLKLIVNCGFCEEFIARCFDSVRSQSHRDWQAYVTIDPCGDRTLERALLARGTDGRVFIHENAERRYAMANLISAIKRSGAEPEDIVVILDGDDWFATPDALEIIRSTYRRQDCWLTYGSWVADQNCLTGMQSGKWPPYQNGITDFRKSDWLGTAVRTWKRWLWDLIEDRDFRDEHGRYFRVTEDQAAMLPMLEMAGTEKARHIPEVLMVYNRSTPYASGKLHYEEMISNSTYLRAKLPYPRLVSRP